MIKGVHPVPGLLGRHFVHLTLLPCPDRERLWPVLPADLHSETSAMTAGTLQALLLLLLMVLHDCLVLRALVHWRRQVGHAEYAASLQQALSGLQIPQAKLIQMGGMTSMAASAWISYRHWGTWIESGVSHRQPHQRITC